jgi:hypothetical protein
MTIQGIIVIDILGLFLIVLIINLARTQKLYIGYAAIWLLSTGGLIVAVSLPPLLDFITRAVGAIFPVSALTLLAFVFVFVLLIFFSVKLTALSERQAQLIQALALRDNLLSEERSNSGIEANPRAAYRSGGSQASETQKRVKAR